jgi:hypothetical protein
MDIDVVVFTPSAPIWHIQGHALHPYIMGDALVVFYRVIYRVITEFYPKPLIWARVAVKCMIAVKLPPLLAYPTLLYLTAVEKSAFQYH